MRIQPRNSLSFACLLALSVLARSLIVDGYMPAEGGLLICPSGGLSGLLTSSEKGDEGGSDHHDDDHDHHHGHVQADGDAPAPAGHHDHEGEHGTWSDCPWQSVPAPAGCANGSAAAFLIEPDGELQIAAAPAPFLRHRTGLPPTRAPPVHS